MATLALPFFFKSALRRNPTCSFAHLEIHFHSLLTSFQSFFFFFFCSRPKEHLSTHHSEVGTCCSAETGRIKWEWSLSLVYLSFCMPMMCPTSAELVLGVSTLDVKSQCTRGVCRLVILTAWELGKAGAWLFAPGQVADPVLAHLPPSATTVGGQGCGQSGQCQ